MAKLLDKILVIDVESTCWEDALPASQVNEIIEIGIAVVDVATLLRGKSEASLLNP